MDGCFGWSSARTPAAADFCHPPSLRLFFISLSSDFGGGGG
uniref:Uncharacterized protein n=1 Tax=Aegilops tauschii subsp. strangulata TaxID=200361 RepID=A0A453M220_AEGTS